jgi:hypothetical protein
MRRVLPDTIIGLSGFRARRQPYVIFEPSPVGRVDPAKHPLSYVGVGAEIIRDMAISWLGYALFSGSAIAADRPQLVR